MVARHTALSAAHYQDHDKQRPAAAAWVDGSWGQELGHGAVGGALMTPRFGNFSFSAQIPPGICAEPGTMGKAQRNAQAELLAILVMMITFTTQLRGADLLL